MYIQNKLQEMLHKFVEENTIKVVVGVPIILLIFFLSFGQLSLKIEDLSEENSRPNDPENGVLVLRVNNGSPAYGKLTRGDIITEVISQGKRYEIVDAESFEELIEQFDEGDKLAIVGRRNNNRFFVAVTVD